METGDGPREELDLSTGYLPEAIAKHFSAGTGALMLPAVLRGYAQEAGCHRIEVVPIDHPCSAFNGLRGWWPDLPAQERSVIRAPT